MEIDLHTKQQLANLLAKPGMVTNEHAGMLTDLVKTYPYYQPLHLLLAKANQNSTYPNHLASAALYNGGTLLHQILYKPEAFGYHDQIANSFNNGEKNVAEADDQEIHDEIAEINYPSTLNETAETESNFSKKQETEKLADNQEVFDEIAEVNEMAFSSLVAADEIGEGVKHDELNDLEMESIVATDFFAFEEKLDGESNETKREFVHPEEYNLEAEAQTVSKYNDDKLPYTFLWWLAKTRKEHEQIFQPYVTPKKVKNAQPNELQQQYVEHIFHLQTALDETGDAPDTGIVHKGDDIIEQFIKNEPQIRAPKLEQINNENKAKKSAEDNYDLVSETLASIYIEQMLYHKAIDTYEKLSLKFPEKSRYFADLIQSLEKKI